MMNPAGGMDQDALIGMFAGATATQSAQLRKAVEEATLRALQGREMTLQNIRGVLEQVAQAAGAGAAQNPQAGQMQALLDQAVSGMDDALLKAVEANRVALQQLMAQGADLRQSQLQTALDELDKFDQVLVEAVRNATGAAGQQFAAQWAPILDKLNAGGSASGQQAGQLAEQMAEQFKDSLRSSREAGLKTAQALADSYAALVSGVLMGMSDALRQGKGK